MLTTLRIKNLALVADLTLELQPGYNAITGETGAGKSIIIGAVNLTLGQQILVAYLAILGGIGTAGVPSGSIPFIIVVLTTIGVNPSLIALILGVDRILDMCRTTLNVTGDITAATYIARSEGFELLGAEVRSE